MAWLCCRRPADKHRTFDDAEAPPGVFISTLSESSSAHAEASPSAQTRRSRKPLGRARQYASVNEGRGEELDVEGGELHFSDLAQYDVHWDRRLGEGAYGEVFLATNTRTGKHCVVKTIKPEKADDVRIKREVRFLNLVAKHPNIVTLLDLVRDSTSGLMMLVFEYIAYSEPKELFPRLTDTQARFYLYNTLLAIHHAHSLGIMHRDLKEANILYDERSGKLRVIDWGFACFYQPGVRNDKWPGTRYFKSPDLFLHYQYYDYSVDLWAFGCILGSIVFQRAPMFRAKTDDNGAQLVAIGRFLGCRDYARYLRKYRFPYESKYPTRFLKAAGCRSDRYNFAGLVNTNNAHLAVPEAIALFEKLMVWDHELRLTAAEALDHPYFDPVRGSLQGAASGSSSSTWVAEIEGGS